MLTATSLPGVRASRVMGDLELLRDERFLEKDVTWRRLLGRLHPTVRRDLIGWMGWSKAFPQVDEPAESWTEIVEDYIQGAALVVDPLPVSPFVGYSSDRSALAADCRAVCADLDDIGNLVAHIIESSRNLASGGQERQSKVVAAE